MKGKKKILVLLLSMIAAILLACPVWAENLLTRVDCAAVSLNDTWQSYNLQAGTNPYCPVSLSANGKLTITVETYFDNGHYVTILDSNYEKVERRGQIYGAGAAKPKAETFEYYLTKGTYYIRIEPASTDSGLFRIKGSFTPSNTTETEPNNSFAQARTIALNNSVKGFLSAAYTTAFWPDKLPEGTQDFEDFYKLNVTAKGEYTITVKGTVGVSQGFYWALYDSGYSKLKEIFMEQKERDLKVTLSPGTYYIEMKSNGSICGPYELEVTGNAAIAPTPTPKPTVTPTPKPTVTPAPTPEPDSGDLYIPNISTTKYIKGYTKHAILDVSVYTDSSLKTKGSSSPYKAYNALVHPMDEIYIYKMNRKYAYISYPSSSGRKKGYVKVSDITDYNKVKIPVKSQAKVNVYKKYDVASVYGYIEKGDLVYAIGRRGGYTQVIYPVGSLYKMGWVSDETYNSKIAAGPVKVQAGTYVFYSGLGGSKVMDVYDNSSKEGTNIQLYKANGTNAQKFKVIDLKNGWYNIANVNGKYLGTTENKRINGIYGPNVQLTSERYEVNQQWRFFSAGNGYYYIQSRLGTYDYYLDVCGGSVNNGTNIQVYELNGTKSQKWKLVTPGSNTSDNTMSSSESKKRQAVVDYMNSMAEVKWTPSKSFTHWSGTENGPGVWKAGTYYYGIPYSQTSRTTNLERFRTYLKGYKYVGPSGKKTYKGSDCSSAVSMAWQKNNTSFPIKSTAAMYPGSSGVAKVGSYETPSKNTSTVCKKNGSGTMYKAYAKLKKGDAVLCRNSGEQHVMLVTDVDPVTKKVKVTHQTTYSKSLRSTWRVNESWSFSKLYSKGYIPIAMKTWK